MGNYHADLDEDALEFLADMAGGDARTALNAIELGILTTQRSEDGRIHITLEVAQECIQKRVVRYDKGGDNHYDIISAFIKSMRGSDPDAAVYYLAKMLYAGEDVKFYRPQNYDMCVGGCGKCGPSCDYGGCGGSSGRREVGMPESRLFCHRRHPTLPARPRVTRQSMQSVRRWRVSKM